MGHSWLPLPSLLGLFGALLMLSRQLLRVDAQDLCDAPINHPYVQKALAFAVEQYNLDNEESANYFKVLCVLKTQWKMSSPVKYHLTVELVKTRCKKEIGKIKRYEKIQECKVLPGNHKRPNCYFAVVPHPLPIEMNVEIAVCV